MFAFLLAYSRERKIQYKCWPLEMGTYALNNKAVTKEQFIYACEEIIENS